VGVQHSPPWPLSACLAPDVAAAGDGLADYEQPPSAPLYYLKGVSSWVLIWLVTQFVFAVIYRAIEPDALPLGTAFYLCICTATTVGYGDVGVRDDPGRRIFASFHILYSVSSLAALLNTVQVLHSERKIQLRKAVLLERQLDHELIASLDKDNNGLDKLEFVVGMLTKLEILHWDDVEPFLAQFDALDTDKSGRLDKQDLLRMVELRKQRLEAKKQRKDGRAGQHGSSQELVATPLAASSQAVDELTEVHKLDAAEGEGTSRTVGAATAERGNVEYGGIAARNRELAAAGVSLTDAEGGRVRSRAAPFMPGVGGLPGIFVMSQRGGRPRRPRHLRGGKVGPAS